MELKHMASRRSAATREPAESHFRKLNSTSRSAQSRDGETVDAAPRRSVEKTSCRFEVYRADEVRMTSTQFGGGDWHWRMSDADGVMLLDTGGYASERECRNAIAILQENAGWARVSPTV